MLCKVSSASKNNETEIFTFKKEQSAGTSPTYLFQNKSVNNDKIEIVFNNTYLISGTQGAIVFRFNGDYQQDKSYTLTQTQILNVKDTFQDINTITHCYIMSSTSSSIYANVDFSIIGYDYKEKPSTMKKYIAAGVYEIGVKQAFIIFGILPNGEWRDGN